MAGDLRRKLALDFEQRVVGVRAGQEPKRIADALQRPPAQFQRRDRIVEARRRGIRRDGGDLGLVLGKRARIGLPEVLGRNAVEGRNPVGGGPGLEKRIGGGRGAWVVSGIGRVLPKAGAGVIYVIATSAPKRKESRNMPRHAHYLPHGVIPAVILPFADDLAIDEKGFRKHLSDVAATEGLSAITVNAHSTEVASCSFDEQRRVLDIAQDEIGGRLPIVNGIWADGSLEAARIARMAEEGGASALLVFPPAPFTLGQSPAMAVEHFKRIADATSLPLIAFQYPLATGQGYPRDTLLKMVEEVPTIRAIKDWCGNVPQHEMHVRELQSLKRPVNVLSTHSAWLLSSLVLGCNGLLSGSGSVIADLQAALFRAVKANDLAEARRLNDRIYPLAQSVLCRALGRHA